MVKFTFCVFLTVSPLLCNVPMFCASFRGVVDQEVRSNSILAHFHEL